MLKAAVALGPFLIQLVLISPIGLLGKCAVDQRSCVGESLLSLVKREEISKLSLHHPMAREHASIFVAFDQRKGQEGFCCLGETAL